MHYRDVLFILPAFVQLLLYASPVGYVLTAVPSHLQGLFYLNPLAAPLELLRWSLLGTGAPHWGYLAYSAGVSILCVLVGLVVFRSMERKFADVI